MKKLKNSAKASCQAIKQPETNFIQNCLQTLWGLFHKNKPVVSVLRLEGVIGKGGIGKSGLSLDGLELLIERAFKSKNLKAVCLIVNSPGGAPVQAELIAARIRQLAKEKEVELISFVEDVAASGGYWLACAGDEIHVSPASIVGSIGVISAGFGAHKLFEKVGLERRVYAQGDHKSVLDPFLPEKAEDVEIIKGVQKKIHEHFINYVKERRLGKINQSDDIIFSGKFWTGLEAIDMGLVDKIGNLHQFLADNFDKSVHIEYIKPKHPWYKKYISIGLFDDLLQRIEEKISFSRYLQ